MQRSVSSALILIIFCRFSSSSCSFFLKAQHVWKTIFFSSFYKMSGIIELLLNSRWKKTFSFSCRKKFNAQSLMKWILRGFTCKEDRLIKFPSFRLKNMKKERKFSCKTKLLRQDSELSCCHFLIYLISHRLFKTL